MESVSSGTSNEPIIAFYSTLSYENDSVVGLDNHTQHA
jgi:hypothetical protein